MTFALDIKKWTEKAKDGKDLVTRKVVFEVGTSLVYKSPVGDASYWISKPPKGYVGGRFRANWQYGLDAINHATSEATDADGATTVARFIIDGGVAAGHVHYFTNSLPYALPLERGHSRQAPHGMVDLTRLEFQALVDKAVSEVAS